MQFGDWQRSHSKNFGKILAVVLLPCIVYVYMSKNVMLSDEAYVALSRQKKSDESFSDVVKRLVPPPIETFGDLEKHLDNLDGPLNLDFEALDRLRMRKRKANRAR